MDPLSYGRDEDPTPHLLLRRGRVSLFASRAAATDAIHATLSDDAVRDCDWARKWSFVVLECESAE
jgi:hypothetical protein